MDNLAWILQHEYEVLKGVTEEKSKGRSKINIFSTKFINFLEKKHPSVARVLKTHPKWSTELPALRDPVAHRIPLYSPPGFVDEDNIPRPYRALFVVSKGSKNELRNLREQLKIDHLRFLSVSKAFGQSILNQS